MSTVMLAQRELRRVPLDFDAPIGKTWAPLLEYPDELRFPGCPICGPPTKALGHNYGAGPDGSPHGDGLTAEARAIAETKYANGVPRPLHDHIRWMNKLGEHEVRVLAKRGVFTRVIDCPAGCRRDAAKKDCPDCEGRGWTRETLTPTAEEVNTANQKIQTFHPLSVFASDEIVRVRCELLGIQLYCSTCEGRGHVASPELRARAEAWEPPSPPEGPGYQLWQTVSEGGPVSPVFEDLETLADWLALNYDMLGKRYTASEWLGLIRGETYGVDIASGALT